jgi:hypothetical protein
MQCTVHTADRDSASGLPFYQGERRCFLLVVGQGDPTAAAETPGCLGSSPSILNGVTGATPASGIHCDGRLDGWVGE